MRPAEPVWAIPTDGECDLCGFTGKVMFISNALEYRCHSCHVKILKEVKRNNNKQQRELKHATDYE